MRFDREAWVKLYKAESPQHRLMSLSARALRDMVLRFVEDDGTLLHSTSNVHRDVCRVIGAENSAGDRKMVAAAIKELTQVGYLQHDTSGRLWIPKFAEAQQARTPEAKRQAAWRETHGKGDRKAATNSDFGSIRRLRVLDGDNCSYCNTLMDFRVGRSLAKATIDHVNPRVHGGSDEEGNLVLACSSCNSTKGDRTPEQAGMTLLNRRVVALRTSVTSNAIDNDNREKKRREGEEIPRASGGGLRSAAIQERARAALQNPFEARFVEPHRWPEVVEAATIVHQALGLAAPKLGMRDPAVKAILELFEAGHTIEEFKLVAPKLLQHKWFSTVRKVHALTLSVFRDVLEGQPEPASAENTWDND